MCNNTGKQYIGSSCQKRLCSRLTGHVRKSNTCRSREIIDGGNFEMILIENFPCDSKDELHKRERYFIESLDCVNKVIPTRTMKEYYIDNKDQIIEQVKEYRKNNKEQILEQRKEYRKNNKERIIEQRKEFYKNNKERILKTQQEYYDNNAEQKKERMKEYYKNNKDNIISRQQQYREKIKIIKQNTIPRPMDK